MKQIFFTPGPSELYFTVPEHIKSALKEHVPSISHRSKEFTAIYKDTVDKLRALLTLPENFHICFTTSATEVWERSIENLVFNNSYHLVNGDFSNKFYKAAVALGKNATINESEPGTCVDVNDIDIPDDVEIIALAQNETSTGAALPMEDISQIRSQYPDPLLMIDAVSSLPVVDIDFNQVDSVYCSVQKCFGLPAGLGVWIFNDRCVEKAQMLEKEGALHNTYHSLPNLLKFTNKFQNPCTPNVLNIFLLGKVVGDMLMKGIDEIRRESRYKAALIYNLFDSHSQLKPFVENKRFRSQTVGVGVVNGGSAKLIDALKEKGMVTGTGYGGFKNDHIRIASFPTHSREQMEMLVDQIAKMNE